MMEHRKQNTKRLKRTGIALLLVLAMLCTVMPIQTEAVSSAPENNSSQENTANTTNARNTGRRSKSVPVSSSISTTPSGIGTEDPASGTSAPPGGSTEDPAFGTFAPSENGTEDPASGTSAPSGSNAENTEPDAFVPAGQDASPAAEDTQPSASGQAGSSVPDGLVQEGSQYLLYQDGIQVTEEGWHEISGQKFYINSGGYVTARMEEIGGSWRYYEYDLNASNWAIKKNVWSHVLGIDYFFDRSGACAKAYNVTTTQLSVFQYGQMVPAVNQAQTLSDGGLYYFAAKGIRAAAQGWKKPASQEWYYTDAKGSVSAKMESSGGIWQYYSYNAQASSWKKLLNTWKIIDGKEYFFSQSGKCTKIYSPSSGKCQVYSKGKMVSVKKDAITLRDGKMYYFNAKGKQVTKAGWQKISREKYMQVSKKGYVSSRFSKSKGFWKFYKYNYSAQKWETKKNVWKNIDGKDYYFSKSGKCTIIYNTAAQTCQKYSKGKMALLKNTLCALKDNKIYYFNAKGIRSSKAGWKKISAKQYAKVGKSGYVTHKITNASGNWKYYKQDYKTRKWKKQKKAWVTVQAKKYYFNAKGNCTRIYYVQDKKCYDYKNGHMALVRNDIRNVSGKNLYFGPDGKRVSIAGLYITSGGKLIYVNAKGQVTKKIRGTVMDYTLSNGKVTSCKVKDANSISYYNGLGILTRKLDLNGKMVALTYDDGPSSYTSVILDILEQSHGVATFFVLGQQVPAHASILKRAYDMGCEIGNHTYSHQILTKVGISSIQSQITSTNNAVRDVTGVSPVVMRPPGGNYNGTVASTVGMPLILWSIDTLDWKTRNAAATQAAVLNHVKDGDIILMHDLYGPTAEASKVIIPELINRGYQLVTVSELADCRGGMLNGMVYNAFR